MREIICYGRILPNRNRVKEIETTFNGRMSTEVSYSSLINLGGIPNERNVVGVVWQVKFGFTPNRERNDVKEKGITYL